jgi:hypothetical protein
MWKLCKSSMQEYKGDVGLASGLRTNRFLSSVCCRREPDLSHNDVFGHGQGSFLFSPLRLITLIILIHSTVPPSLIAEKSHPLRNAVSLVFVNHSSHLCK